MKFLTQMKDVCIPFEIPVLEPRVSTLLESLYPFGNYLTLSEGLLRSPSLYFARECSYTRGQTK